MHRRGRVFLLVQEVGPVNSCLARENHLLVGPGREDLCEDWGPGPVHPAQGAAEWACPMKRSVAGLEGVGWVCPRGRAADWWGEQKRPAFRPRAFRPRGSRPQGSRPQVLVLAGVALGGPRATKALTVAQRGEAEGASPHWR